MPKLLSAFASKINTLTTLFEIRLVNDVIVLHGERREASSQLLSGTVALYLPHSLKVEDIHLKMSGQLKISLPDKKHIFNPENNFHVEKQCEVFSHKWMPFVGGCGSASSSKNLIMHSGFYEWPFELVIPGSMAESIQGLRETYLIYNLRAKITRGKLAHDLVAWKPIRIIRTLESADAELSHPMVVENVWPGKIEYLVMVPQRAVVFGTAVDVEMTFTILLKGLSIGDIKCQVMEILELPSGIEKSRKHERCIGTSIFHLTEENYREVILDNGRDGHALIEKIPLPKKLSECLQDCEVHGIRVRHRVKFFISLHNPDGHVSELRATIPIIIYFSPRLPLTAYGELVDQSPVSTNYIDSMREAPPLYGDHVLDQLYAAAFQSGMTSPSFQSGMNTPMFSHSRTGSGENLAPLDGTLSPYPKMIDTITPAALSSRLQNLSFSSRNSSFRRLTGLGSSGSSTSHIYPNTESEQSSFSDTLNRYDHYQNPTYHSNPLSRRGSGDTEYLYMACGKRTPNINDKFEMSDLNRVPSYRTAAMTSGRSMNDNRLPNYEATFSVPSSPSRMSGNYINQSNTLTNNLSHNIDIFTNRTSPPVESAATNNQRNTRSTLSQADPQDRRMSSINQNSRTGSSLLDSPLGS